MPPRRSSGRTGAEPKPDASRIELRGHIQALGLIDLDDDVIDTLLERAVAEQPAYTTVLEWVFGHAARARLERRIGRRLKASGMTVHKTLEAFDFDFQPDLERAVIEELATLSFIERRNDLLVTGKSGTGKSHILLALALRACRAGYIVKVARCVDLLAELYAGIADGTFARCLQRWARADFVVIDDVGLGQLPRTDDEPTAAHLLYNIIDLRHDKRSTAITSNIRLSDWGRYLGDVTVTAAILDRLAMTSTRIEINGPSFRQHLARQRSAKPATKTSDSSPKSKSSKS